MSKKRVNNSPYVPLPEPERIDEAAVFNAWRNGEIDMVCVLGPTASGKTRYAVRLAGIFDAMNGSPCTEIISADSRQVYRGMDIGSGKDKAEYGQVPFHMIDIADAGEKYNLFRYKNDFGRVYSELRSRGKLPLMCGGSGLYIQGVVNDHAPGRTYFIGLLVSREERNALIDSRLDARIEEGLAAEVQKLLDGGLSADDLIYYGLEYKFVTHYLTGVMSFDEMRYHLGNAIHQFAKRQMTFFRSMEKKGCVIHWTVV